MEKVTADESKDLDEEINTELPWKLVWDEASSTRDRRPTTPDDIWNDVHVEEGKEPNSLYDRLIEIYDADEEDYPRDDFDDLLESIKSLASIGDDLGDGSPNILFLQIGDDLVVDLDYFDYDIDYGHMDEFDIKLCMIKNDPDLDSEEVENFLSEIGLEDADYEKDDSETYYDDEVEDINESLTQKQEAYNKALKLAKSINKPVVYGYTKKGKFYEVNPKEYHGDDTAFRSQYSANTAYVAYPDKDSLDEASSRKSRFDYDDAVDYLEANGVSCDPNNSYGEFACDLLDDYCDYDKNDDPYYTKGTLNSIIRRVMEAKANHEYDDDEDENDVDNNDTETTIIESYDSNDFYDVIDKDLVDEIIKDDDKPLDEALENKKARCLDMYNNCKDWATDPASYVSCRVNVDYNRLKEWLKEGKN